jgi:hypothetical protein
MNKEFSSEFTVYHVMLKVSLSFMGGRLHNQFVSMACPNPFLSQIGPAPKGCVVVFCSSNSAKPSPSPQKNQQCIILDESHHGTISTITKCNIKKNTKNIAIAFINLHFD